MGVTKTIIGVKKLSEEPEMEPEMSEVSEETLSVEELEGQEMVQLIKKVLKEGKDEAKLILKLETWKRPGSSFSDYGVIELLYGEILSWELDSEYDYPTTSSTTYAIIPKTKTVAILFKYGDDYDGKLQEHETIYVFSSNTGWKSIDLF